MGLRRGEVLGLTVAAASGDTMNIEETWTGPGTYGGVKWGKPRDIPVPGFLKREVKEYTRRRKLASGARLICSEYSGHPHGETWFRKRWNNAIVAGGIGSRDSESRRVTALDSKGRALVPYSLMRHPVARGCSAITAGMFLGHEVSLSRVPGRYTHLGDEDLRQASLVDVLEQIFVVPVG